MFLKRPPDPYLAAIHDAVMWQIMTRSVCIFTCFVEAEHGVSLFGANKMYSCHVIMIVLT